VITVRSGLRAIWVVHHVRLLLNQDSSCGLPNKSNFQLPALAAHTMQSTGNFFYNSSDWHISITAAYTITLSESAPWSTSAASLWMLEHGGALAGLAVACIGRTQPAASPALEPSPPDCPLPSPTAARRVQQIDRGGAIGKREMHTYKEEMQARSSTRTYTQLPPWESNG
jgi:hypothetical protein